MTPPHETTCPACGAAIWRRRAAFPDHPEAAVEVCSCGMLRTAGLMPAVDQYEEQYYARGSGARFTGPAEALSRWFRRRRTGVVEALAPAKRRAPGGRVLDIGCGNGVLLAEMQARGWEARGTQVSQNAAEYARRRLGLEVFVGELTSALYDAAYFDVIMMWHVLEHLPCPSAYLAKCQELLADDGVLLVEVPNAGSIATSIGGVWAMNWDPPNHLWHFTPQSLLKTLGRAGFEGRVLTQWSWEFTLVSLSQSIVNRITRSRNTLLQQLGASADRNYPVLAIHATLGVLSLFLDLPLSLGGLAFGRGEIIRAVATKRR